MSNKILVVWRDDQKEHYQQSVTKFVETLSDVLQTSKGENIAFPPPSPPCNVVPLFELTYRNTPTLNKEVWIALFSEVTPFEYNVSTILLPIVASKTIIL